MVRRERTAARRPARASSPGRPGASAPRSPARSPRAGATRRPARRRRRRQGGRRRARRPGGGRRPRRPRRDPRRAAAALIDALGGIDVLVNNAGILRITPLLDITVEEWDLVMDVNARSMLVTTQVAARVDDRRRPRRADRQHGEHGRQAGRRRPGPLRGVEGGRRRADPGRGDRARPARHQRQRDLPRLRADRDGRRHAHPRDGRRRGARRRRSAAAPSRPTSPAWPCSWRPTTPPTAPARRSTSPVG